MLDSEFWRQLAEMFVAIDPQRVLRALWQSTLKTPYLDMPIPTRWQLVGSDRSTQLKFETLARRGGTKIHPMTDSLRAWLEALREHQLNVDREGLALEETSTERSYSATGTISSICEASADLCKIQESIALEIERLENLHPQFEHGSSFESVGATGRSKWLESQIDAELEARKQVRIERRVVELREAEQSTIPLPMAGDSNKPDAIVAERMALIQAYKRECKEHGIKVTDEMIAKAASPKWNDRTPVTQWKRNDPACSPSDDRKIRAVLVEKYHLKKRR